MIEYASCPKEGVVTTEEKSAKKVEKLSKKYLTTEKGCDIIVKLSARAGSGNGH